MLRIARTRHLTFRKFRNFLQNRFDRIDRWKQIFLSRTETRFSHLCRRQRRRRRRRRRRRHSRLSLMSRSMLLAYSVHRW